MAGLIDPCKTNSELKLTLQYVYTSTTVSLYYAVSEYGL